MAHQLREFLLSQLKVIDGILAGRGVPVPQRPLEAAYIFAAECIVEVAGRRPDDPLMEPWFGDVLKWTQSWYVERYGSERVRGRDSSVSGLILIFDTPFRLEVPITVTEPGPIPETAWVVFPDKVLPTEQPLDWIVDAPATLPPDAVASIEEDVRAVATLARSLDRSLSSAELEHPIARQMATKVSSHFERAIEGCVSLQEDRMSSAVWEFFLAVEMSAKTVLYQRDGGATKTHSLSTLFQEIETRGIAISPRDVLSRFPTEAEAIRYRYGERSAPPLAELHMIYQHALHLARHAASSLTRTIEFADGRFLIRKLPWARNSADDAGPNHGPESG